MDSTNNSSMNEAYVVLYSPKKGVKPVSTAAYKDKKDAEKWAKDLGGITMIVKKKIKGIDESLEESMFSAIDQIRQDSKDVRDFVKNVFKDREFKKMSNDKEFIKYLKSIYEGTMIDEEHVKFSNRTPSGTIATGSVQTSKESVNESASKEAMGIAALTGTRGSAVQDFIDKNRINSRKLFKALKSANLQGRINFASALAGKPNNPNARLTKKLFGEDKKQIKDLVKRVKFEKIFYDVLSTMEKRFGKRKYRIWLEKSLKDFGENPKHYDYRTNASAEEKLFQLGK